MQLPLSTILEFTQHDENCSQSHGLVQSFAPLLRSGVRDRYQVLGALWIWASGDVTSDNEARVGVTMGRGVMMVVNTGAGERLRLVRDGGVTPRDIVTCDV